jgi:hypothetical protein
MLNSDLMTLVLLGIVILGAKGSLLILQKFMTRKTQ